MTTVPTPACGAPEPCFCSPERRVPPCPHWVLPAWPWWRGGGPGWCWAGLGPRRTGSCEGGDGSALGAAPARGPCLQRPPGLQERGGRGGTCRVTAGSGCAGTRSSPPPAPQAPEDHRCHLGTLAAAASCRAVGPRRGPNPAPTPKPPAGWAPAETACTAPRSSCGGKRGSGGVSSITSPTPSCAGGLLPGGEHSQLPNNSERGLPGCWPLFPRACVCVCAQSLQSCPPLCNPVGCSPPGSSVHGTSVQITGLPAHILSKSNFSIREMEMILLISWLAVRV